MPRFRPKVTEQVEALELTFAINVPMPEGDVIAGEKGDFLVTRADGTQFISKREDFLAAYEEVRPAGRKVGFKVNREDEEPDEQEPVHPLRGNGRRAATT